MFLSLVTCQFYKDLIKKKLARLETRSNIGFPRNSRATNSNKNSLIWPELKLVREFMPVLIIRKFDKDPVKTEHARLENSCSLYI